MAVINGKRLVVSKTTGERLGEHYILLKVIKEKTHSDHVLHHRTRRRPCGDEAEKVEPAH